jgi:hypothetical protein
MKVVWIWAMCGFDRKARLMIASISARRGTAIFSR